MYFLEYIFYYIVIGHIFGDPLFFLSNNDHIFAVLFSEFST